jgi:hypothetical protein
MTAKNGILLRGQYHVTVHIVDEFVDPEFFIEEDNIPIPMITFSYTVLLTVEDVDPDLTPFHHPSEQWQRLGVDGLCYHIHLLSISGLTPHILGLQNGLTRGGVECDARIRYIGRNRFQRVPQGVIASRERRAGIHDKHGQTASAPSIIIKNGGRSVVGKGIKIEQPSIEVGFVRAKRIVNFFVVVIFGIVHSISYGCRGRSLD